MKCKHGVEMPTENVYEHWRYLNRIMRQTIPAELETVLAENEAWKEAHPCLKCAPHTYLK